MIIRVASVNRHSQQAVVEAMNKIIGKAIHYLQLNEELADDNIDEYYTEWVKFLPNIKKVINANLKKIKFIDGPDREQKSVVDKGEKEVYPIGLKVRVALDYPKTKQGKRIDSNFRAGDQRWSNEAHTIENVLIYPNQPIRYVVSGIDSNTFSKNQIKPYVNNKFKAHDKYDIEKLLKRFKKKGKVYFEVKWEGYDKTTEEPRSMLIKDVPLLVKAFEKK